MINIEQLRRERGEIVAAMAAIAALETAGTDLSAEQLTEFGKLEQSVKDIDAKISRLEQVEALQAASARPVVNAGPAIHVKEEAKQYPGSQLARFAMSMAAGDGDIKAAAQFAATEIGDKGVAMALSTTSGSGGALIPQNVQSEVIELLRPRTVVRKLGARAVPLPNGNLSMPKMTGGATANYVGEGSDAKASNPTLGDVKLSAKTLITLVPMSNQLIGRAGIDVESLVLTDMLAAMAVREDKAFLRDDGTSNTPKGFKKVVTDATGRVLEWKAADTTGTVTNIDAYLDSLILALMNSDSMMITPGWVMSPRSYMRLFGLRDGNGNKVYPEMSSGLLKGFPVEFTNNVPANLGTGTNESEIYFADWNDVVIGEQDNMTVDFSREATYDDGTGTLVSAFARNQSVLRVVVNHDIGFRHEEGLVMGSKVLW